MEDNAKPSFLPRIKSLVSLESYFISFMLFKRKLEFCTFIIWLEPKS